MEVDLSIELGSLRLANPVLSASGTSGYGLELEDFTDFTTWGGFITKSVTLHERPGNPGQRTVETAAGMLNAIGLANVGLERFCKEKIPILDNMPIPVFVNVAGKTIEEYVTISKRLSRFPQIKALELNISCPNVKQGGIAFGTDPKVVKELVSAVRCRCPEIFLIVKLSPNVTDITVPAQAAIESGADALSMVNTFLAMAIDIENRKPVLGFRTGGLSGPAIKPMAIYQVNRVYNEVTRDTAIPIIGLGGIATAADALEFIIAGASAVAVGTNLMIQPNCIADIVKGISKYLDRHGMKKVTDLVGTLQS